MKLKFYRFMETVFSIPAAYFGDLADSIDINLHKELEKAMKDSVYKELKFYDEMGNDT